MKNLTKREMIVVLTALKAQFARDQKLINTTEDAGLKELLYRKVDELTAVIAKLESGS